MGGEIWEVLGLLVSATVVSVLTTWLIRWATNSRDEDEGAD